MLNTQWEDFFGIEEVFDDADYDLPGACFGMKKDAVTALASCINTKGCVDMGWMMDMSGLTFNELKEALNGAIYQDPEKYDVHHMEEQGWMLRAQYLSGNIKTKLDVAKNMNRKYKGLFESNVLALREVLPDKVDFDVVGFSIGSPWIPEYYYAYFAKEIMGLTDLPKIIYSKALGRWNVRVTSSERNIVQNHFTYGTLYMPALKILEITLNGGTVKVYDEVSRPDRKSGVAKVLNKTETLAAQEKQELLQNEFQKWVRKDAFRVKQLKKIFYDTFACNVAGRYSGSFLELPGLDKSFIPYKHQKDAVARIILERDVLLNHEVGTGKTGIIVIGIHEKKRIGLSDKNLVVVPNNVLDAFEQTHQKLYPDSSILVVHPQDFKPDRRQAFLAKIRDEDYEAVYMAYSSFQRLGMSRQYKIDQQKELIRTKKAQLAASNDAWERRRLETMVSHMGEALAKMQNELPFDEYITFDELGITTLVVDEAHNFKNISTGVRADGVIGMPAKGSKKCDEMLTKVQYVRARGGSIIFSTGTPLTNSISDLYVLQMFLQPEQMRFLQLDHFDEWINNFAERKTQFEIDLDSRNYRIKTRFSHFHNMPELTSLFANVCDFYSNDEGSVNLPESECYSDVIVEKTMEQEAYIDDLVERTEKIRQKLVRATEDNLLKVTNDGRAAALDIRLADPMAAPDIKNTKIYACAKNVYQLWKSYPDTAQLVFCDLGTPKNGFNVYDELKQTLVKHMGIPGAEIAYVHDAKTDSERKKLFEDTNNASVRILIGSTAKLGTGVNVQKRLIAIHHLDIPWKPSDVVQREGRLIRQGNTNDKVFRFRYITAGTFDAYSWQILENKERFISQFMNNRLICRDARDIGDSVLTYAEIKALAVGDPLLKKRIDTSNELERLKMHCRQRDQELKAMEKLLNGTPATLAALEAKQERLKKDYEHFLSNRESMSKDERLAFGQEVLEALLMNGFVETERWFDDLHGFRILLPAYMQHERPTLLIEGPSGNKYDVNMREAKAAGCIQRIEYILSHLNERVQAVAAEKAKANRQAEHARAELAKGNSYRSEVDRVSKLLLDIDEELNRRTNEEKKEG